MRRVWTLLLCFALLTAMVPAAWGAYSGQPPAAMTVAKVEYDEISPFSEGLARFKQDGKYGFMKEDGTIAIQPVYTEVSHFQNGYALAAGYSSSGARQSLFFIDQSGNVALNLTAGWDIQSVEVALFSGSLAALYDGEYTRYIDNKGVVQLKVLGKGRSFYGNLASVHDPVTGLYGFIDRDGYYVVQPQFERAWDFDGSLGLVMQGGLLGFIDTLGQWVFAAQFDNMVIKDGGMAPPYFNGDLLPVKFQGSWYIITRDGRTVTPTASWDEISYFQDGVALVAKGDQIGAIDAQGRQVLPASFKSMGYFYQGFTLTNSSAGYLVYDRSGVKTDLTLSGWDKVEPLSAGEDGFYLVSKSGKVGLVRIGYETPSWWAVDEVNQAKALGIVPDELLGSYTANITRAEFCKLVVTMIEAKTGQTIENFVTSRGFTVNTSRFPDTQDRNIAGAAALGIVNGRTDGTFAPGDTIDRQEAAAMLERAAKLFSVSGAGLPVSFTDAGKIGTWAKSSVDFVSAQGVMQGSSSGAFDPLGKYSREQSILTALRLYNVIHTA